MQKLPAERVCDTKVQQELSKVGFRVVWEEKVKIAGHFSEDT